MESDAHRDRACVAHTTVTTIRLSPTIEHCIQTISKLEYERMMLEFLGRGDEDPELMAKLELLYDFHQTANYSNLRGECDRLFAAGKKVTCIIKRQEAGAEASCTVTEQLEDHDEFAS